MEYDDENENEYMDEEDDGEEESIMGLGTMMQERVDYLSSRKREEYRIWKDGILEKIKAIEMARTEAEPMDTT
jgi:origin recognition complex subunit 6